MPGHIDERARRSVKQLFRMGTSTTAIPNAILWLFCLQTSVLAVDKFILEPASTLTAIQTESIELTWILEMTANAKLISLKVELKPTGASKAKADAFYKQSDKSVQYRENWAGRDADFSLNVTVSGRNVTVHFIMKNLNKATDEGDFDVSSASSEDTRTSIRSALTINVPPVIISSHPYTIHTKEAHKVDLVCNSTGFPAPTVNWTRNGALIGTGNPYQVQVTPQDHNQCYTCVVFNGVYGAKTANVCLAVQFKPYGNHQITFDKPTVCQNNKVNVTCKSGPSNPPASNFIFYYSNQLVQNSSSHFYIGNAKNGIPGYNMFSCIPGNLLGDALNNVTGKVVAKVTPTVTSTTNNPVVSEGSNLALKCNVSGSPNLTVTWTRSGKPPRTGKEYTITNINRADDGPYHCTVDNGDECPTNAATINVAVNYKPENTSLKISTKVACLYDKMTLTCVSHAKPPVHNYKFYRNRLLIANSSNGLYTYNMTVNGSNVYTCTPENTVGSGQSANVTVQVKVSPIIRSVTASQDVVEGSNFTLNCDVWDNSGSLDVSWHRVGGGKLSNSSSYTFENILRTQTGFYECLASNGNECDATSKKANIKVQYQPKITSSSSNSHTVDENDLLTLTCKVDGYPTPTITWKKEGGSETLHQGDTFIFRATGSAKGKYSCSVSNGVGLTQSKSFDINVVGYCGQHQCRDGTVCVSQRKSYYCKCKPGLKGRFCEDKDSSQSKIELLLTFSKPTFTKELADKSSKEFKDTEKLICDMLRNKIFPNSVDDCSIIFFRSSSLESNVELRFTKPKLLGEIEESIKNATSDGTKLSDDLVLKGPYSFKASAFGTPCSKNPCQFDGVCKEDGDGFKCECQSFRHGTTCEKGIGVVPGAIIIAACLLLLIVIIFLCCLYFRRSNNSYEKEIASYGTKMDEMRYRSTKDHVASSENYSFEEEYLRQGRYRGTPLSRDNESDQEIEDKNKNLEFQTFNKKTEVRSIHAVSPDPTYTDIIAAMMNTPDEHQSNDTQNSTNESLDNVEVEGNSKASTLKLEKEKPNDQESSAHVDTKMTADYNGPLIGYTSNYDESSPNSTKECKQENPYIIDNSNFTMDPKESEGKLYPKLNQ